MSNRASRLKQDWPQAQVVTTMLYGFGRTSMAFLLSPSLYVSDAMLPRLSEREGEERGAAHCVGASSVVQWSRRRAASVRQRPNKVSFSRTTFRLFSRRCLFYG